MPKEEPTQPYPILPIGQRVTTEHGIGTIKSYDVPFPDGSCKVMTTRPTHNPDWVRYGILHDVYPKDRPKGIYKNDLLYFHYHNLILEKSNAADS